VGFIDIGELLVEIYRSICEYLNTLLHSVFKSI